MKAQFKEVYTYNELGRNTGACRAQLDKNGNVMLPPNSTAIKPLGVRAGYHEVFDGDSWVYIEITDAEIQENAINELKSNPPTSYHKWNTDHWVEDLDHAKSVRMEEFREMRIPLFDILGIEQLKAEDTGNASKLASVRLKRQALRDIPQSETWGSCSTCSDIANYTPSILTEDLTQL